MNAYVTYNRASSAARNLGAVSAGRHGVPGSLGPATRIGPVRRHDGVSVFVCCHPGTLTDKSLTAGQFVAAIGEQATQADEGFLLLKLISVTSGQRDDDFPDIFPGDDAVQIEAQILGALARNADSGAWNYHAGCPPEGVSQRLDMHALPADLLNSVVNLAAPSPGQSFPLGRLRWTEHWDPASSVPVRLPLSDIVGKRSAMFGKTRLGKSNVVKLVMQGVLQCTEEHRTVGQLVFDVNGEYANDNPQDGNYSMASAFRDRVLSYFLATHKRSEDGRFLRYDFFRNTGNILKVLEELLPVDVVDIPAMRNVLVIKLPVIEDIAQLQGKEHAGLRRRLFLFWTLLAKAGFKPNENVLEAMLAKSAIAGAPSPSAFNPALPQALRLTAWQAIRSMAAPKAVSSFAEMVEEMEVVSQFALRYENDPSLRNGRVEFFDEEDRALQTIICERGGAGPYLLRPCLPFHSPEADDFVGNTLQALDEGKTVIIDMGAANERIIRYFSKVISSAVFLHQEGRFITGQLGDHYIQVFFEEAHMIFPAHEGRNTIDIYARFAREGAKFHIGIVYATQSPSSVSASLLTQTENFFVGHLSSPRELEILCEVQSQFRNEVRGILQSRVPGYLRVLTFSNRYVLSIQADRFESHQRLKGVS